MLWKPVALLQWQLGVPWINGRLCCSEELAQPSAHPIQIICFLWTTNQKNRPLSIGNSAECCGSSLIDIYTFTLCFLYTGSHYAETKANIQKLQSGPTVPLHAHESRVDVIFNCNPSCYVGCYYISRSGWSNEWSYQIKTWTVAQAGVLVVDWIQDPTQTWCSLSDLGPFALNQPNLLVRLLVKTKWEGEKHVYNPELCGGRVG